MIESRTLPRKIGALTLALVCESSHAQAMTESQPLSIMTNIGFLILAVGILWAFVFRRQLIAVFQGLGVGFAGMALVSPEINEYRGFAYFWCIALVLSVCCWLCVFCIERIDANEVQDQK